MKGSLWWERLVEKVSFEPRVKKRRRLRTVEMMMKRNWN